MIDNISGCFQGLDPKLMDFINENKTQIRYLKGETIIKQGAFSPHVLFVNQGLVKIYLQTGNKKINIRIAAKGDFIAFSSVFGNATYPYSAVAMKDAVVCMINKEALREILMKKPEFGMRISAKNSQNERRYLELIENLSYKQMRGKLASALLYLTIDEFKDEEVFSYLTRKDIADFASITNESAIKFLKEFEQEKLIALDGKQIDILDRAALVQIRDVG